MTESEAVKEFQQNIDLPFGSNVSKEAAKMAIQALEEVQKYREIGSIEECRASREKQIPKNPTYDGDGYAPDGTFVWDEWICPCCGTRYEVDYDEHDFCPNCGQKIDWGDENEID